MRIETYLGTFLLTIATATGASASVVDILGDQDFFDPLAQIDPQAFIDARDAVDEAGGPFNEIYGRDTRWVGYSDAHGDAGDPAYGWVYYRNPDHAADSDSDGWVDRWMQLPDYANSPDWTAEVYSGQTYYRWSNPSEPAPHGADYAMIGSGKYALEGELGVISYTHSTTGVSDPSAAWLQFGLIDHDSDESGEGILIEVFDEIAGAYVEITDWYFDGPVGGTGTQSTVIANLHSGLFSGEADILQVRISALSGPCEIDPDTLDNLPYGPNSFAELNYTPSCHGNGIGVDYSMLIAEMPLPMPAFLLLGGLAGLGLLRRKA